ncbi:MurR/RpiR family transcriptional regulator [Spiroplasma cantharicola]|uniref:HTH rpiR-type domain-containing protein n=1 Tax=Spiroplasma cantharicola TaxID=362837 RepID=A0A0M4K190_9MOLU|nr:MurR/RpiR family transcriptional regulator [Spiroplasma cantharicola]ALD66337.1 hypothetical protein SCANT_v1c04310 [Spiroplasma cantharicola]
MNIIDLIKENENELSPQERKVIFFIKDNLNNFNNISIKNISKQLNVQESVITKSLSKIGIGGFKKLKLLLEDSYYSIDDKLIEKKNIDIYFSKLIENINSFKKSFNSDSIIKLSNLITSINPEIIFFATGKTAKIIEPFFFNLLELNFKVKLETSLYNHEIYDVKNKLIIIFTISGNNSKVFRYLNLIKEKNALKIIGISTNESFANDLLDDHIFGTVKSFFTDNSRSTPLIEKYTIQLICDALLLMIISKSSVKNLEMREKISTKNKE